MFREKQFIVPKGGSKRDQSFHLSVLETTFLKTLNLDLCRKKEFPYAVSRSASDTGFDCWLGQSAFSYHFLDLSLKSCRCISSFRFSDNSYLKHVTQKTLRNYETSPEHG